MVRFLLEHLGAESFTPAIHKFSDFKADHGVLDLPLEGDAFTWSNSCVEALRSRIDRFLLLPDWEDKCPFVCQRRMAKLVLDHFPILLEGENF